MPEELKVKILGYNSHTLFFKRTVGFLSDFIDLLLQLAREQAQKEAVHGTQTDIAVTTPQPPPAVGLSHAETPAVPSINSSISPMVSGVASSPVPVTPFVSVSSSPSVAVSGSLAVTGTPIAATTSVTGVQSSVTTVASQSVAASGGTGPPAVVHANASSVYALVLLIYFPHPFSLGNSSK